MGRISIVSVRDLGATTTKGSAVIISHSHRFIFLKTNKTAGTSVEIALSKFCDDRDVLTPFNATDEALRQELGTRRAQNYQANLREYSPADWAARLLRGEKRLRFYNHIPASLVQSRVSGDVWSTYYKFCIERNPWDRVVSSYFWRNKVEPRPSLSEWLDNGGHKILKQNGQNLYCIDDKIVVDRVLRFENLAEDLEEVRQSLGLRQPLEMPRAKGDFRKDRRHYREILTPVERDRIASDFAFEIATFGYEF